MEIVVEVVGNTTFIPEKSKIDEEGRVLSAYYEPDEECIKNFAPVVLLMEQAETEILNGVLQGRAQATAAPYWAKSGLELDGQQLIEKYNNLIPDKYKKGRL
jgi:hypothetical protein